MARHTGCTAIGRIEKDLATGTVLRIRLELVLNVRDGTCGVTLIQLECTVAILTANLCVFIEHEINHALYLPEGLVAAGCAHAATFDLALIKFFLWDRRDFGGHGAFLEAGFGAWWEALYLFYAVPTQI
jgi:hypothetical protein